MPDALSDAAEVASDKATNNGMIVQKK